MANRRIVYPGQIPLETDILATNKESMIGLGYALQAALGTGTSVDGLGLHRHHARISERERRPRLHHERG